MVALHRLFSTNNTETSGAATGYTRKKLISPRCWSSSVEKIRWGEGGGEGGRWKNSTRSSMEQNVNAIFHRGSETVAKRRETTGWLAGGSIFRLTTRPDIHLILFAVSATFDPSSSSFPSSFFSFSLSAFEEPHDIELLCKRIGLLVLVTLMREVECRGSLSSGEWHARWLGMPSIEGREKLARLTGAARMRSYEGIVFFFLPLRVVIVVDSYGRFYRIDTLNLQFEILLTDF